MQDKPKHKHRRYVQRKEPSVLASFVKTAMYQLFGRSRSKDQSGRIYTNSVTIVVSDDR